MPKLFALDHNFPLPIVDALRSFMVEADLIPLDKIDHRLAQLDDWQVLVALHNDARPWDGLITTDSGMITLPRELAAIHQTKLTLVVAADAGHDPLKATGLVLTHLPYICAQTQQDRPQIWVLRAYGRDPQRPWHFLGKLASQRRTTVEELFSTYKIADPDLARNPLR